MDALLIVKILVLAYILISPFINHSPLLLLNATPAKILLLIVIVFVSFVDLQLAILLMIAFLVLLVNLNNLEVSKIKKLQPVLSEQPTLSAIKERMRGNELPPIPSDVFQPSVNSDRIEGPNPPSQVPEGFTDNTQRTPTMPRNPQQTMFNFPAPYCKGLEHIDPYEMSKEWFLYSTDEKTKPYEEYVRLLSPDKSLQIIQTNELSTL